MKYHWLSLTLSWMSGQNIRCMTMARPNISGQTDVEVASRFLVPAASVIKGQLSLLYVSWI